MSFDQSRSASNPWSSWRDFLGVVMQQGRVQLDSDGNEWLAEIARRIQAGTLDLVGMSGVPSTTPFAFKINANAGNPPQITISAGRIYVDGLLAENHGPSGSAQWDPSLGEWSGAPQPPGATSIDLDFTNQPYLPGASAPTAKDPFLVYLDVWQREVTYLECPELIEPAVGIDTTGRLQTVWQVKLMDVSATAGGPPGGVTCSTPDASITNWEAQIQPSSSQLTTVPGSSNGSGPCSLNSGGGYTGLENQLYRVQIFNGGSALAGPPAAGLPPSGTATFVWSRENASVAAAVSSIASANNSAGNPASQLTVQSLGRDQVLGFKVGDWVEITADYLELNAQPGELHQIDSVANKTITLDSALSANNFPVGQTTSHTRVRRWDQSGTVFLADGATVWTNLNASVSPRASTGSAGIPVPPPGVGLLLEDGVAVSFGPLGNSFSTGEFWTITARAADGSIETLSSAPPAGIRHHYCRLAIVDFSASPPIVKDCRRVFPALANPSIHVSQVQLGNATLSNGSLVSIQDLMKSGVTVSFDNPLDPAIIPLIGSGSPICTLSVDLPATSPAGVGFSPLVLGATVKIGPSPNTILWTTTATGAALPVLEALFPTGTPFVAHLTLKGGLIWAQGQPRIYLNGAGDGRPSADFALWFWLSSQPPTTLSATSVVFATPQLVGASASQPITFTNNNNPNTAITISSITFGGANPADFSETNSIGATFPLTLGGGQTCTITITFKPAATGTRTAQMSIVDSADSAPQVVTLSGTAVQPAISAVPPNLTFLSAVVGSVSAAQSVVVTNAGSSQLTISGISIDNPNFVQSSNCLAAGGTGALQPGQSCTVQVQFVPIAAGSQAGKLTIANNASSLQVPLTGTAVQPVPGLTASTTSLTFGSVSLGASPTLSVTILSTGNTALVITGVGLSGTGFTLVGNTCGTLPPGAQCTLTVKFAPLSTNNNTPFTGTLTVTHNAAGSPLNISLSGTGVGAPAVSPSKTSLSFAVVADGTPSPAQSVTVTSSGTAPLTIGQVTAGSAAFKVVSNSCGGSLAPGATCSISVTFATTAVGKTTAGLSIPTNAGTVTVTLSGTGIKKPPKEDGDGKGGIIRPALLESVKALRPQIRQGLLPPTDVPAESESAAATGRAFIQPEERPPVGVDPPSPPDQQTPDAKQGEETQPDEGPKEG